MNKTVKPWRCTHFPDKVEVPADHVLITMPAMTGNSSFSLCIPLSGFHVRNANISRYGRGMKEYFADGKFLGVFPAYKEEKAKLLYANGKQDIIGEFLQGSWRWPKNFADNLRTEAA